jgi:hypothetical protein
MQNEYEWTKRAGKLLSEAIPADHFPRRVAITGVGIITAKRGDTMYLLLCNPHPSSWNNWLLPYGSITTQFSMDGLVEPTTFGHLANKLDLLFRDCFPRYGREIFAGIGEMLGWGKLKFEEDPFFSSYSLKYSKSANAWTAYLFKYHRCTSMPTDEPSVASTWMPLNRATIDSVTKSSQYDGLAIAGNVITLVADDTASHGLGMSS